MITKFYSSTIKITDLCPKPNLTDNPLSKKSHVEEFTEPIPGLFQALTDEPDPQERWLSFTYPVDIHISLFIPKIEKETKYHTREFIAMLYKLCFFFLFFFYS